MSELPKIKCRLKKGMAFLQLEPGHGLSVDFQALNIPLDTHTVNIKGPGKFERLSLNFQLPALLKLSLQDLEFDQFSFDVKNNSRLTTLNLKNVNLNQNFPAFIQGLCVPLKFLQLSKCRLDSNCFRPLTQFALTLESLDLSENEIQDLPDFLQQFEKLKRINLDGNKLSKVPLGLKQLPRLNHLSLDGNNFDDDIKAQIQKCFNIWF